MKPVPTSEPFLDLQDVLETRFQHIVDHAVIVGWTRMKVIAAIADLADKAMLVEFANSDSDRPIREAFAKTIK